MSNNSNEVEIMEAYANKLNELYYLATDSVIEQFIKNSLSNNTTDLPDGHREWVLKELRDMFRKYEKMEIEI